MRFEMLPKQQDRNFAFAYRNHDRALISVPAQAGFGYSLCFNEVQLELSETGLANHAWGYCPRESWQAMDLEPPEATSGELRVVLDSPLVPGVAVEVSNARLPVFYNEQKQWLCFGNPSVSGEFRLKLAPGMIVVGNSSLITALWIRVDRFTS
jgi:hypothetical protein